MAFLKLSDAAFGNLGLTITESIDLSLISQQLSDLLDIPFSFDSLDVSAVTRSGLTATGSGAQGSSLAIGDYEVFAQGSAISGFEALVLTDQSIAVHGNAFEIRSDGLFAAGADFGLDLGADIQILDFSMTGLADLSVFLDTMAPFDSGIELFEGYQVVGNAGDNIFYGFVGTAQDDEFGSSAFYAGEGNDGFSGGRGSELFEGGAGNDEILGHDGDDLLLGYLQEIDPVTDLDTLLDRDIIFGGGGDDIVDGGPGDDLIYASQGMDSLTGGSGRDRFIFAENALIPSEVPLAVATNFGFEYFAPPSTGAGVSDSVTEPNTLEDFTSGEDRFLLQIQDFELTGFATIDYVRDLGEPDNFSSIAFSADGDITNYRFIFDDVQTQLSPLDMFIRVDQSEGTYSEQFTSATLRDVVDQASYDASFEIVYSSAGQGNFSFGEGLEADTFSEFQINPTQVDGVPAGQDKFDLSALELGRNGVEAIEDILFTNTDFGLSIQLLQNDPGPLEDFFFDADAGVNRALHVEFDALGGFQEGVIGVYVDADLNGSFEAQEDMFFQILAPRDGSGQLYVGEDLEMTAQVLYDDPGVDGSGTGIFIFDEAQYDFWFNDIGVV